MPLLFNYYLSTDPQPLQAGEEAIQANGTINVHIAQGTPAAFGNQIVIAVPVGAGGIFQQPPTVEVNTGKWVISSQDIVKGKVLGLVADQDFATFIFDCQNQADFSITYNFVISLSGLVTATPGALDLAIQETSGTTDDPSQFGTNSGTFTLEVVSPVFYLKNLVATATGAPTVPRTELAAGVDINLQWESNGTWFQVYKKGETAPFWSGSQTTTKLTGGVSTDTTFFVIAAMTGDPSQDQTAGFNTIFLFENITVTISNPVLTPTSIATSGDVTVGGNLSVQGTAGITGLTTLGSLTTTGAATLASAVVSGPLNVTGGATIGGGLTGTGSAVAMLTGAVAVQPGTFMAATDGFALGVVAWPPNVEDASVGIVGGGTDSIVVYATGGNLGIFGSQRTYGEASNGNMFILPVRQGASWWVNAQQGSGNEAAAPTAFYWFPLGSNGGSATFARVSDEVPALPLPRAALRVQKSKDPYVEELVDILGLLADKPIPPAIKQRLSDVLRKLNSNEYEEVG
jgi:hypothetical protein